MAPILKSLFGSPKALTLPPTSDEAARKRTRAARTPPGPAPIDIDPDPNAAMKDMMRDVFREIFTQEYKPVVTATIQVTVKEYLDTMQTDMMKEINGTIQEFREEFHKALHQIVQEKVTAAVKAAVRKEIAAEIRDKAATMEERITKEMELRTRATLDEAVAAKMAHIQEAMEARWEVMDNKFLDVSSSVEALERNELSTNCVVFGIVESSGEKHLAEVKSLFGANSIVEARRMGKFNANAQQPRPVLIKFCSVAAKHAAFKHAKALREKKNVTMDDQLTKAQRESRAMKQPWKTALHQQGCKTFWRGDILFKIQEGRKPEKVDAPPAPLRSPTSSKASSSRGA